MDTEKHGRTRGRSHGLCMNRIFLESTIRSDKTTHGKLSEIRLRHVSTTRHEGTWAWASLLNFLARHGTSGLVEGRAYRAGSAGPGLQPSLCRAWTAGPLALIFTPLFWLQKLPKGSLSKLKTHISSPGWLERGTWCLLPNSEKQKSMCPFSFPIKHLWIVWFLKSFVVYLILYYYCNQMQKLQKQHNCIPDEHYLQTLLTVSSISYLPIFSVIFQQPLLSTMFSLCTRAGCCFAF